MAAGRDGIHSRIAAVVHEVNRILVGADSRRDIETGVCETVAASEPYRFAWLGEYSSETGCVEPRVAAGVGDDYLDDVSISVDDEASQGGPTALAVETDTVQVMQDIRNDPAYEPWRDAALERGFESSAAVPLLDDGVRYGILNVYAERPHAFDDDEQRLLSELAETVATAISGVEAKRDLEAERRKYRRLTERISDAYYAVDNEWRVTYWNDRMAARTGTEASEVEGVVLWEAFPELRGTENERRYRTAMRTGEPCSFETYLGGPADYWVNVDVYPDEDGLSVFSREITERKERERELERNRAFLERIQSVAGVGGWEVDFGAEELEWTEELYRIHGVPPDYDPTLEDGIEFYHPDDRGTIRESLDELRNHGSGYDHELRIITADGETRWVHAIGEPIRDGDEVVGARGTFQDITERRAQQEELRALTERFDLAIEGANLGLWDWNVATDAVTFNQQWAEMLGLSLDDIDFTLETWEERIHPDDIERVQAELSSHLDGETDRYDCEHRMRTGDGDWKWIRDVGRVVERDDDGEPVRAVGIHADVTERKRTEQKLQRQRDNLELLNEMVRHDIRNDLQVILMFAELLAESVDTDAVEQARTIITRTEDAIELTESARDLAETMLRTDDDYTSTSLREVLERELEATRSLTGDVTVRTTGRIPAVDVLADDMLASVFRNVLNNAVTHNDADDPTVAVSVSVDPESVRVAIADNGPGIPDGSKAEIFGRGEKGLESSGTGIGLYLVDSLVTGYGGDVSVRDRDPDEFGIDGAGGAVFCLTLPRV